MDYAVHFEDLEKTDYKTAWDIQEETLNKVLRAREDVETSCDAGTLFFVEHPHVYTLGKSGQANNLLINEQFLARIGATYFQSNRGGDITYHGPGQIVGYPVFDLNRLKIGARTYIEKLEDAIIALLEEYHLDASQLEGATGVWLDAGKPTARKICAIGVRVSRGVTMHGFALNVHTDLSYFSHINPCGFQDKGVTSIAKELNTPPDLEEVKLKLKAQIARAFQINYLS